MWNYPPTEHGQSTESHEPKENDPPPPEAITSANYGSLVVNLVSLLYRSKMAVAKKNVGYPISLRGAGDWLMYVLW